ncbi:MAG: cyclodeaminase/cyclohydrolase family protein, partial [Planctomycetes bacterium]|nr:cyclodeaminase/cyclohydrolase family protein [Planctomycetota bacterium]
LASVPPREALLDLGEADQRAFAGVLAAWGLPRGPARKRALATARGPAVSVPEAQLAAAREISAAAATLAEVGNPNLVNDAAAACEFALAAGRVAALNARANQAKAARRDYGGQLRQLESWAKQARDAASA